MEIDHKPLWSSDFASIDPTFNVIFPRGVVLQRDLPSLTGMRMGAWPDALVCPFMHEIAHHWCFRGSVGNVLAAMNFRSSETALIGNATGAQLRQALEDHLTFRAVLEFLRPLCEGMALFAEFDAGPGRSAVISDPVKFTYMACSTTPVATEREVSTMVWPVLRRIRASRDGVTRKANVLTHPKDDIGQAYFEGYLMVKILHKKMMERLRQAADPDWFLCYLRDYIFSDPGLIVALLQEPEKSQTKYDTFVGRVCNRLWELLRVTSDDAKRYSHYANYGFGPNRDWSDVHDGLNFSVNDSRTAGVLADELLGWLEETTDDPDRIEWRNNVIGLLERRGLSLVAAEQIPINVANGRVEALFKGPDGALAYATMPALDPSLPNRRFTGWAAIILQLDGTPRSAIVLGGDKGVVAARTQPDAAVNDPRFREIISDRLMNPHVLRNVMSIVHEAHQRLRQFAESEIFHGPVSSTAARARRVATSLAYVFIPMMSRDWEYGFDQRSQPDSRLSKLMELIRKEGLWPLFNRRASTMNVYIRTSVFGAKFRTLWKATEAHAAEVENQWGVRLIEQIEGKARFLF